MVYDGRKRGWHVDVRTRDARRVEYLFNVQHADGEWTMGPDPGNALRSPGPFGDKSVVELPGYQPPAWLAATQGLDPGEAEPLIVRSRALGYEVPVLLWTTPGHDTSERLPLLVALDGPELAQYASLLRLLAGPAAATPVHVALVAPVDRDQEYSASAAFARALANELLPAIASHRTVPDGPSGRAGIGASLGGLALLHAHRTNPDLFGALLLQSGSFFQRRTDAHESWFVRFARVSRFVRSVLTGAGAVAVAAARPIRVVVTCGTVEENLANNRAVATALERQGYDVTMVEHPDGHNWISWRDVLDPHLPSLLAGLRA
jgi:enterochelin esterase family protein